MAENQTPGRREAAKAAKRARILAAAQAHLHSVGYEAMTMARVARDADVAIGTVFTYAATKAELLMMVTAERWSGQVPLVLAAPTHDDPVVAIRELLQPLVDTSTLEPQTCAAIARELLFGTDGPHQQEVLALVATLEQGIARIIAGQDEADERCLAAGRLVVSGGLMEVNRQRTGRAEDDLETRLTRLIELVLNGAGQ